MTKLNERQKLFCKEYLIDLNATQAAIRAGYSKKTAQEQSSRLLSNVIVSTYLQGLLDKRSKKLEVSAEKTLNRLMQGQEFDVRKLYNDNGTLKKPHELDDDTAKAVVGVKYDNSGSIEYKIIDVKGCTELVGRHIKLFGEDAADTSRPIVVMPTIKLGKTEITFDIGSEPDNS